MNHFIEDQFAVSPGVHSPDMNNVGSSELSVVHSPNSLLMRQQLIQFIQTETSAEERKVRLDHEPWVTRRIKKGNCITGLKYRGMDANGFYTYSFKDNESRFRDGDILVLNDRKRRGAAVLNEGVPVWLEKINHRESSIKLEQAMMMEPPQTNDCTLDKGFIDFNSARLLRSVEKAYASESIPALIEGRAVLPARQQLIDLEAGLLHSEYPTLTPRQCAAVASAKYRRLTLIQGPPGTGKSFLLAHIIEAALRDGKSVLVTGPSHRVINSLIEAVVKRNVEQSTIKLVSRSLAHLDRRILQCRETDKRLETIAAPYLVGASIYKAATLLQERKLHFDLVVIDEAGQMPVVHGIAPLLHADQYVIAGDHKQLAPIIHAPLQHPEHLRRSLFEHLHESYPHVSVMLDVTFRMNIGINEFPSNEFYDSLLKPNSTAAERSFKSGAINRRDVRNIIRRSDLSDITDRNDLSSVVDRNNLSNVVDRDALSNVVDRDALSNVVDRDALSNIIDRNESVTFIELDHRGRSSSSPDEAELVARLAKELLGAHRIAPCDLAIISPLKAHNERIRKYLNSSIKLDAAMECSAAWDVVVDTVNRLQGQEREVVIFSLCSSDREYLINSADFLFDPHRLNVAITRSKTRLFVVGSKYFFPHEAGIIIDTNNYGVWKRFYEYLVQGNHRVVHANP